MKQQSSLNECKKYSPESVWGLNMLFAKDTQDVVITVRYLIHKCLWCEYKEWCKDKYNLVKFLESNDTELWVVEWKK